MSHGTVCASHGLKKTCQRWVLFAKGSQGGTTHERPDAWRLRLTVFFPPPCLESCLALRGTARGFQRRGEGVAGTGERAPDEMKMREREKKKLTSPSFR